MYAPRNGQPRCSHRPWRSAGHRSSHRARSRVTPRSSDDSAGVRTPRRIARRERRPSRDRTLARAIGKATPGATFTRAFRRDAPSPVTPLRAGIRVHAGRADSSRSLGRTKEKCRFDERWRVFARSAKNSRFDRPRIPVVRRIQHTPRRGSPLVLDARLALPPLSCLPPASPHHLHPLAEFFPVIVRTHRERPSRDQPPRPLRPLPRAPVAENHPESRISLDRATAPRTPPGSPPPPRTPPRRRTHPHPRGPRVPEPSGFPPCPPSTRSVSRRARR